MKHCPKCSQDKSLDQFSWNRKQGVRQAWCKSCFREYAREYEARNRADRTAKKREWSHENRDLIRARNEAWRRRDPALVGECGDCGICGDPIDMDAQWPDPASRSLDHIVPLSRGGAHVSENVQWTHLRCNVTKGARMPEREAVA